VIDVWENYEVTRCVNTGRPLTHSLDLSEEGLAVQATRICSLTDCDRPHFGRGLCQRHLERQRRQNLKNGAAGRCAIEACEQPVIARDWCEGHYRRWMEHGDPLSGRRSPDPGPCAVVACERPKQGRGLCIMHYNRWKRTGDPEGLAPPRVVKLCSIEGCDRKHRARGWCQLHHDRWLTSGDPLVVHPIGWCPSGALSPQWAGDAVKYNGMHLRLRRLRGRARWLACVDCGGKAAHWSYDHADPDEVTEGGYPYSLKIEHYEPRCRRCHTLFDRRAVR
jgi:hypothetical protein